MQRILIFMLAATGLIATPMIGSSGNTEPAQGPRVTVVYKNQSTPTLEELGQKAGDPAQAGVPEAAPVLGIARTEQWI